MQDFYVDFGEKQVHRLRGKLIDSTVACHVKARSEDIARNIFCRQFGLGWKIFYRGKYFDNKKYSSVISLVNDL